MGATVTAETEGSLDSAGAQLARKYAEVRWSTEALCATLQPEDYVIQSMADASPTKWHLAHTAWFFETFVLGEAGLPYHRFHSDFAFLFNSYYVQAGERWQRPERGLLSRPTVKEVYEFRAHVDQAMLSLLENGLGSLEPDAVARVLARTEIGINHEQQHQELLLTDIKHLFSINPLHPVFRGEFPAACSKDGAGQPGADLEWRPFGSGTREIGFEGSGFSYDNESPRHKEYVPAFELASRTVTCGEFLQFMEDGGYKRPELWLSVGWAAVEANGWQAPLYWQKDTESGTWKQFTLSGLRDVRSTEPVTHISFFEADAYARWRGCDLPTEAMWETACFEAGCSANVGNFAEDGCLHPVDTIGDELLLQMLGNTWEWTSSAYSAYPGYRAPGGALGEYNGKFMCNQMVLRGGSCATPRSHIRPTYRNFFPPEARWQFSGIRLARYTEK